MGFCLRKRLLFEKPAHVSSSNTLWVHCASVGEFNTFKPILRELKRSFSIVLTYFSPRAKSFLEERREFYDTLFPLPADVPCLVRKFESLIRPTALIVVEREMWLSLVKFTSVKKVLVNAYAKGGVIEKLLAPEYSLILARTEEDKHRFLKEGAKRVVVCGNLKVVQEEKHASADLDLPEGFKLLVAGSTHPGEEGMLVKAFKELRKEIPLKLVIAPRHVERAVELKEFISSEGLLCSLRSEKAREWEVLLLDTLGELRSIYALADVVFVGGTFAKVGGHNLLEPAYFGKPVVFGPNTRKVEDLKAILLGRGQGFQVSNYDELLNTLKTLLKGEHPTYEPLSKYAEDIKRCYLRNILRELQ